ALWPYLYAARFNWDLREIIRTNELTSTWLDYVVKEDLADRVGARSTIVKNGEEGRIKLIVENRITCLANRAAKAGAVSHDLKAGDIKLSIVFRVERRIVNYRGSFNSAV